MDRSYVCTTDRIDSAGNATSIVGTNSTQWVQFSARPTALAGNGLVLGSANELDVNVDGSTLEVVADVVKIKNPDIKLKVERGLLRSTTNGIAATSATVDASDPTVLGATVPLGNNITVAPDFTVLPDLQNVNTFTAVNTFDNTTNASWTVDGSGAVTLNGAVVVNGGVAVRKDVIAERSLLKSTTDATSTTTGALIVDGGVGIAKALHCGGDVFGVAMHASSADVATWSATGALSGALTVDGHAVVRNELHSDTLAVHNSTDSTSPSTGAVTVVGGLGVAKNVSCPTATIVGTTTSTNSTSGALTVAGGVGIAENANIGNNCNVTAALTTNTGHVLATTAATNDSTGALVVEGGVGIGGAVYIGDDQHVAGNVYADNNENAAWALTGAMSGAIQVEGGVAVRKDLRCANLQAHATTAATSSSTGALVVSGGMGVASDAYVGNDLHVINIAHCDATTNSTWHATDPLTGSLVSEGGIAVRNDVHCSNAAMHSTVDSTWSSTSPLAGSITTEGGLSVRKDVDCLNLRVNSTTASTSQSTGALLVSGGLGVAGNVFCTSTYNMSDQRLKRNVKVIDDALDRVCKLHGYTFEWNERMHGLENTPSVGVIAQEVRDQAPLCVSHNMDTDLYAVEDSMLIPYMIESIKALKPKCDWLEQQNSSATVPSPSPPPSPHQPRRRMSLWRLPVEPKSDAHKKKQVMGLLWVFFCRSHCVQEVYQPVIPLCQCCMDRQHCLVRVGNEAAAEDAQSPWLALW